MAVTVNVRDECVRENPPPASEGVSPLIPAPSPTGSWGGSGLLSSCSARNSSPGAERRWPPGSVGKRRLQEREALGRSGRGYRRDGGSVEWSRSHRGRISSPAQLPHSLVRPAPSACEVEEARASGLAAATDERGGHSGVTAALGNLRCHGRSLSLPFHPGGKQEARRLAERRTGAWTNEHSRWRERRRMRAKKRGGTTVHPRSPSSAVSPPGPGAGGAVRRERIPVCGRGRASPEKPVKQEEMAALDVDSGGGGGGGGGGGHGEYLQQQQQHGNGAVAAAAAAAAQVRSG
ncbi:hypothetical protein P7K49_013962 [Saguinus oedipus]|uniref:Uncharacterized protein n=1 Tax=Saguinus oedipus TaxID=9490 RepID=A0ABQ9VHF1_SAGOE|nr:hypothetical protein P7K49_013962 [Saguinus oedipus]